MKKIRFSDFPELSYVVLAIIIFLFSKIDILAINGGALSVIFMAINAIIFHSHLKGLEWLEKKSLFKTLAILIGVMPFFFFTKIMVAEKIIIVALFIANIFFVGTNAFITIEQNAEN